MTPITLQYIVIREVNIFSECLKLATELKHKFTGR